MSSCCWASPTPPDRCRSSSAASPGAGPGAGSPPRRSLGGTATREEIAGGHWTEVVEEGVDGYFFWGGNGWDNSL